jgi:hypothetical protein
MSEPTLAGRSAILLGSWFGCCAIFAGRLQGVVCMSRDYNHSNKEMTNRVLREGVKQDFVSYCLKNIPT